MAKLSAEELEKRCLRKIEILINIEKDPNTRISLENTGRAICTCISQQQAEDTNIINRVMKSATGSIPVTFKAPPERIRLKSAAKS